MGPSTFLSLLDQTLEELLQDLPPDAVEAGEALFNCDKVRRSLTSKAAVPSL